MKFPFHHLQASLIESRTGRALSGLLTDYVGSGITQCLSLILTPVIVRLLSPALFGYWVIVMQVLMWLNLLDGGTGIYLIREIAAERSERNNIRVSEAICTAFWCYVGLAGLTIAAGMLIAPRLAGWVQVSARDLAAATLSFQIAVLTAAVSLVVMQTFYAILQGQHRLALANAIVSGVSASTTVISVILLLAGGGVVSMAVGQLCATCLGGAFAYRYSRQTQHFTLSLRYFRVHKLRQIFHFTFFFQLNKLSFLANTFSDGLLLGGRFGTSMVSVYSLTQKLPQLASFFLTKVNGVILPGLSELYAKRDIIRLQQVILRLLALTTRASALLLILILTLNDRFVHLWVGSSLYGGFGLTALFGYLLLYNGIIGNMSSLFISTGQFSGWGYVSVTAAVIKIGLTIVLLSSLGIWAPAVATVIGGCVPGIYAVFKTAQLAQLRLRRLLFEGIGPTFLRSFPMFFVVPAYAIMVPLRWGWTGITMIGLVGLLANIISFDSAVLRKGFSRRSVSSAFVRLD